MRAARGPRWALSFADLCLLLLAFFVLLQAERGNRAQLAAGMRAAFSGGGGAAAVRARELAAATMFEPGEALLLAPARARLGAIGRDAARSHAGVRIESVGSDPASARFDGWELAAARAAAIARAIAAGGEPAAAIDVAIPATTAADVARGQRITVTTRPGITPSR